MDLQSEVSVFTMSLPFVRLSFSPVDSVINNAVRYAASLDERVCSHIDVGAPRATGK